MLNRAESCVIIRFISSRLPLNRYIFDRGSREQQAALTNGPMCDHCGTLEDAYHFIYQCKQYKKQRQEMKKKLKKIGIKRDKIGTLMFPYIDGYSKLEGVTIWRIILQYMVDTARFSTLYHWTRYIQTMNNNI